MPHPFPPRRADARSIAALVAVALLCSGCAVMLAAAQPPKRDVSVFLPGTPRGFVVAEVGEPVERSTVDGVDIDTFVFQQGYAEEVRALRVLVHGAADIATCGLWEVVGTPFELYFDGEPVRVQVRYDGVGRVLSTDVYAGHEVMEQVLELAPPPVLHSEPRPAAAQGP